MKKFQYKVVEINKTTKNDEFETLLNSLGKDGWEIVFPPFPTLVLFIYIFKREIV